MVKQILMIALLFISVESMAQKVVDIDSKAIVDNRDMPAKAITLEKKARVIPADNSNPIDNIASDETNKTVSHYFEVMKTDLNGGATMNWVSAISNCATHNSGDDDITWRLPTQRELMLIWILHKSLITKAGFTSFSNNVYWCAKIYTSTNSWSVEFNLGGTTSKLINQSYRVRCVRDLTPPAS